MGLFLAVTPWVIALVGQSNTQKEDQDVPVLREPPKLELKARVPLSGTEEVLLLEVPYRSRTKACVVYRDASLGVELTCLSP